MTKSERKVIFTLVGIFVAILLIVLIVRGVKNSPKDSDVNNNNENIANSEKYVTNLGDDVKLNNSKDLNSTKKFNNIEFSNIQFAFQDGNSVLLADAKNVGSTTHEKEIVTITILDENNAEITTFDTILTAIEPGETKKLNAIVTADIVNAKDFKIEAKKSS